MLIETLNEINKVHSSIMGTIKKFDLVTYDVGFDYIKLSSVTKDKDIFIEYIKNNTYKVTVNKSIYNKVPLKLVDHLIVSELSID